MVEWRQSLGRFVKYGLVGVVNTLASLTVIGVLDLGLHAPPALANTAGYACGIAISYALNKRFVFRSREGARATGPRFLVATAGGFLLNLCALQSALWLLGPGAWQHAACQIFAMGVYTVSVFLACQLWVFKVREGSPAKGA